MDVCLKRKTVREFIFVIIMEAIWSGKVTKVFFVCVTAV